MASTVFVVPFPVVHHHPYHHVMPIAATTDLAIEDRMRFFKFYKQSVVAFFETRILPNLAFPPLEDHENSKPLFEWSMNDRFYWRPDHNDVVVVRRNGGITEEYMIHPDTKEEIKHQILWEVIYPRDIVFNISRAIQTRTFQQLVAHHTPRGYTAVISANSIKLI